MLVRFGQISYVILKRRNCLNGYNIEDISLAYVKNDEITNVQLKIKRNFVKVFICSLKTYF